MADQQGGTPRRHLSPLRVLIAIIVVAGVAVGAVKLVTSARTPKQTTTATDTAASSGPWFAPYVDTTLTPTYPFQDSSSNLAHAVVLGFVVANPTSSCTPSWGAAYSLSAAQSSLNLDNRIARYRQQGGNIIVSFGGQANKELAETCQSVTDLTAAYQSVISRYHLSTIDLDLEGSALTDTTSIQRRAQAIKAVQDNASKHGGQLAVWLTLPVSPSGLTPAGTSLVETMLKAHVDLAGVNALTMDYGKSRPASQSMLAATEEALNNTHSQILSAYQDAGQAISASEAWSKLGATPMIGQNDTANEQFSTYDATQLVSFAKDKGMGRLSMWSLNRDTPCGPNQPNPNQAANNCSGVNENPLGFSSIFNTLPGRVVTASDNSTKITVPNTPDNPATSPYPIWQQGTDYPQGYLVVWQHTIYQAKWNNQGDAPNAPVASASDTPWLLIGPVLSGQHAPTLTTVPPGTYPAWSSTTTYMAGATVEYQGIGYTAKWYNQGDAPGVNVPDPGDTPWQTLTPEPEQ